mmetsp:Transcript_71224/g.189514  ORF Transcript_71224/g.189514 Transcript_71224/m.189514 type:complete len:276 (-) Transcript_71224:262-1089(-)
MVFARRRWRGCCSPPRRSCRCRTCGYRHQSRVARAPTRQTSRASPGSLRTNRFSRSTCPTRYLQSTAPPAATPMPPIGCAPSTRRRPCGSALASWPPTFCGTDASDRGTAHCTPAARAARCSQSARPTSLAAGLAQGSARSSLSARGTGRSHRSSPHRPSSPGRCRRRHRAGAGWARIDAYHSDILVRSEVEGPVVAYWARWVAPVAMQVKVTTGELAAVAIVEETTVVLEAVLAAGALPRSAPLQHRRRSLRTHSPAVARHGSPGEVATACTQS